MPGKCRQEKRSDFGLFRVTAKNHTVNHTPNEEWGFPRHAHAGKPHSSFVVQIANLMADSPPIDLSN